MAPGEPDPRVSVMRAALERIAYRGPGQYVDPWTVAQTAARDALAACDALPDEDTEMREVSIAVAETLAALQAAEARLAQIAERAEWARLQHQGSTGYLWTQVGIIARGEDASGG